VEVTVIASTELKPGFYRAPYETHEVDAADELAEFAGRLCYQSWRRPNPATATNEGYLANILRQGHYSVLEHASVSFLVQGVTRSLLAELTRHRHLSFSVVSQRYVDHSEVEMAPPPILEDRAAIPDRIAIETYNILGDVENATRSAYKKLLRLFGGIEVSRKEQYEAARAVLPQMTTTEFVVTGNMRAWRDVLKMRLPSAADREIRQFAQLVLAELEEIAPNSFQDFEVDE
jgi:thymidylate synthase (FAD)